MRIRHIFVLFALCALAASGQAVITNLVGDSFSQACGYTGDGGPISSALVCNPQVPVSDSSNNLYFVDAANHVIRKITPAGIISTIAGTGVQGTAGDGGPAINAQIGAAGQLAYDGIGNICFGDQMAFKLRCVSLTTGQMRSVGAGINGYAGDGGSIDAATFGQVTSLAFIPRSANMSVFADLYFADYSNNVIRKVDGFTGVITTLAGTGVRAYSGDGGPASAASLNGPGIVAYNNGSLYILEVNGFRVRAVNLATGIINTVAGNGISAFAGDGGPATAASFTIPWMISFDPGGMLYVADAGGPRIRRIDATGVITTIAGGNGAGTSGPDNVVPAQTFFRFINGMSWNNQANQLLVADSNRIRQINYQGSTTQLAVSPSAYSAGTPVTLAATVLPAAATGSVSFFYNFTLLGTSPITAGQASLATTATASGGNFWAIYQGDATYASSASGGPPVTLPPSVSLTSNTNPSLVGSSAVYFQVSMLPASATGTIQLYVNGTLNTTATLVNGGATLLTSFTTVGTYNITATYSGDANNAPATSGTLAQVISANPTATNVVDLVPVTPTGQTAFFSTTVVQTGGVGGPPYPAGTLQIFDNGTPLGTPQSILNAPFATTAATPPLATTGVHTITVAYSGDATHAPSTSAPVLHMVKLPPNLTLTSSANPAAAGQSVTYTVTTDPAATGTVNLSRGSDFFVSLTLVNGRATYSTSTQTPGTNFTYANYLGDASYVSSTVLFNQAINPPPPAAVTVTSSVNPTVPGTPVTFTANVTPASATGTIQFLDGTTALGTVALVNGTAAITVPTFAAGAHSITAAYSGDSVNGAATSPVFTLSVRQATSITVASSANPSTFGASVAITATITPATASGQMIFTDGITIGSVTITNGTATINLANLTVGTHTITAGYGGDTNNASSGSPALAQVVNKVATTTSLTSSSNPAIVTNGSIFTATVTPATATGTVQFLDGSTVLGSSTLTSGTATLNIATLAVGTHSMTAVYTGDSNNAGSTSTAISQVISKVSTTTTLASSANPAAAGTSVGLTVTVTPSAATGAVQFLDGATVLGNATLSNGAATLSLSTLAAGTHNITAVYSGDTNNASSSSTALTQVVNKAATATSLTSSSNPAIVTNGSIFTATVTPGTTTGTVQFLDGTTVLGSSNVTNGVATLAYSALTAGSHNITAVYSGDANNSPSTSLPVTQVVTKIVTAVYLSANLNPSTYGAAIGLTALVSPTSGTGTVQFMDGTTVLGTATISAGSATFTLSTLTAGTHSLTAVYSGDANNATATSTVLSQVVNKVVTITALASSVNPSTAGSSVGLTATVTPATATGTVQFLDGATVLGNATISNGTATLSVSTLAVGTHGITAVYSGDANNAASTSPAQSQVVNKGSTATALVSNANPSNPGSSVGLTATVNPATATGTVQFLDGATVLGNATLSNGTATLSLSTLATGTHSITAVYSGDPTNQTSTSAALSQVVNKISTATALVSNANPSYAGSSVGLTATVTPSTATGTVQFLDGATVLATSPLSNGVAVFSIATLTQGTHSITAVYSGDATDSASTSTVLTQTVNAKITTTITLTSTQNPAPVGGPFSFIASVAPSTATGTVQFLDGTTVLGTTTLAGGSASFATPGLTQGTHSITAVYSGDATNNGSTSAALSEAVKLNPGGGLVLNPNPAVVGQTVTLTMNLAAAATGTVQFFDGGTLLATVTVTSGSAAYSTSTFTQGSHTINALYSGDANYLNVGSALTPLTINPKATTGTAVTSSLNPSIVGGSVTFTATITPSTATGAVQFLDGSVVLGMGALASGKATFATTALTQGAHSITAVYGGDALNAGSTSAVLTQTVNAAPPGAPSNLTATAAGSSQINLAWTASATSGVTYNVYSSTTAGFTPSASNKIASGLSATTYSATGLTASTAYYYRVTANNAAGESAATSQSTATTGAAGGTGCHVAYSVTNQWNVGFGTTISIQNTGTSQIKNWVLTWTWPGNQAITQSWNATYSQTGAKAALTYMSYNSTIAPGASVTGVGFNASYSGTNTAPTAFYVNGTLCH